jgi:catechol 2,3-dioxygenase-like lactoylglutathione lyase family enzyme
MTVFNHAGIVVTDLERSKRFYQDVLGFQFWYEINPPDEMTAKLTSLEPPLGVTASYYVLDGFVLEFLHYSEPGATKPFRVRTMDEPGLTHLSIAVDDIHESAKTAVELGGELIADSDIGVGLFVRDPDGQLIELLPKTFRDSLPPKP